MNKSRFLKLLAYLFVPVIFSVIGYIILYIAVLLINIYGEKYVLNLLYVIKLMSKIVKIILI